jgi:uncharacterized protein YodC (DUF2158 family)
MMEHEFKAGDVVQLKSGGPSMTIKGIDQYGMSSTHDQAKCVWFEGKKQMEGLFDLLTLRKDEPVSAAPPHLKSDYPSR